MAVSSTVKAVVLDIEGTVCPISFVKDVLFSYALKVLPETVKTQWDSPKFQEYRGLFPPEFRDSQEAFQAHVVDLVSRDQKVSYLKFLQGYLWAEGYASGEIKAPLFDDVSTTLSRWHGKGVQLMIYSSGSVDAQKLLFKHTNAEPSDLTWLISDWFDTTNAGPKTESASYETITNKHPEFLVNQFLFLSDNVKEVEAAIKAGMRSVVVQRPGNAELPADVYEHHEVVETFESIEDDFNVKRLQTLGKRTADEVASDEAQVADPVEAAPTADEGHESKRQKATEESETETSDKTETTADGSKQEPNEAKEEPSRIDKLIAQAVGDAPPSEDPE